MSDKEKPETGVEDTGTTEAPEEKGDDAKKKKRASRRRSVWVCIPSEWEEVAVQDEDGALRAEKQPTSYSITECRGGQGQKKEILRVLALHQIDPSNYEGVLIFRADPVKFDIGQQLIIRIKGV